MAMKNAFFFYLPNTGTYPKVMYMMVLYVVSPTRLFYRFVLFSTLISHECTRERKPVITPLPSLIQAGIQWKEEKKQVETPLTVHDE